MAQDLGIPVLIHTGSSIFPGTRLRYGDPLHLDDVAVDFPDLKLVMAHSGRGFWYDRAFFMSRLHKNVYMEISGLPPSRLLEYFPDLGRNADKVIFGSDWPGMPHIKRNIEAVAALPLPPAAVEKILGGNAARLLALIDKGSLIQPHGGSMLSTSQTAVNSIGMGFVGLPAGAFLAGSPAGEKGRDCNEVQRLVSLTKAFQIQTTPLTHPNGSGLWATSLHISKMIRPVRWSRSPGTIAINLSVV